MRAVFCDILLNNVKGSFTMGFLCQQNSFIDVKMLEANLKNKPNQNKTNQTRPDQSEMKLN